MTSLDTDIQIPEILNVLIDDKSLVVELSDGRSISVPLSWYPRLFHANENERKNWRLVGKGEGIHWPAIDEDISVRGIIAGKPSQESHSSFKKWLEERGKNM